LNLILQSDRNDKIMFFVFFKLRINQSIRSQKNPAYVLIGFNDVTVNGKRIRFMEISIPVEISKEAVNGQTNSTLDSSIMYTMMMVLLTCNSNYLFIFLE
jgi:hypothetical protein